MPQGKEFTVEQILGNLWEAKIEKSLADAGSSGQTDFGMTARVFGSLLAWLNDQESDVFFVGT
jgi:hypothetical protein